MDFPLEMFVTINILYIPTESNFKKDLTFYRLYSVILLYTHKQNKKIKKKQLINIRII